MAEFLNVCFFRAVSGGTVSLEVASAITGFLTPAGADAVDGVEYAYRAESDDMSQWEVGYGIYDADTQTLTRSPLKSSNANALVNFSAAPRVRIVALAADLPGPKGDPGDAGPAGADGDDAYVYIAYADDDTGTGFTMTFDAGKNYIAIKSTTAPISAPAAGDFTGLWKNYKGATGATGADGTPVGFKYTGSGDEIPATPPTAGQVAFNTLFTQTATALGFSVTDADTNSIGAFLRTLDDSTNTIKGHLYLRDEADPTTWAVYAVSSINDNDTWIQVNVAHVDGPTIAIAGSETWRVFFVRAGDAGAAGGLTEFTEINDTAAPNDTIPFIGLSLTGTAPFDMGFDFQGGYDGENDLGGAFSLQKPDGTFAGGNKRGAMALDLQLYRLDAADVAAGDESTAVGFGNKVETTVGVAVGHNNDLRATTADGAAVAFGISNTCIPETLAINDGASAAFGVNNSVGDGVAIGIGNDASKRGVAIGYSAITLDIIGAIAERAAHSQGQMMRISLSGSSADATPFVLTTDGNAAAADNQIVIGDYRTYAFHGYTVARADDGTSKVWKVEGVAKQGTTGAASFALIGTPTVTVVAADAAAASWDLDISADTTNGCPAFTATGDATLGVGWQAYIHLVEISW